MFRSKIDHISPENLSEAPNHKRGPSRALLTSALAGVVTLAACTPSRTNRKGAQPAHTTPAATAPFLQESAPDFPVSGEAVRTLARNLARTIINANLKPGDTGVGSGVPYEKDRPIAAPNQSLRIPRGDYTYIFDVTASPKQPEYEGAPLLPDPEAVMKVTIEKVIATGTPNSPDDKVVEEVSLENQGPATWKGHIIESTPVQPGMPPMDLTTNTGLGAPNPTTGQFLSEVGVDANQLFNQAGIPLN